MIYSAIGVMSGSSLDGLDIVNAVFEESGGKWNYSIKAAKCYEFDAEMKLRLQHAVHLPALDYQLLHTEFGHFIGLQINQFIAENSLEYKVHLISSHGHTTFHLPSKKMTSQLGDGAAIAAVTKLPVVCDLRNMDIALGGQGAPIVPIGEKLLFSEYAAFLNIGGIANISINKDGSHIAFDVCSANRVINMLANEIGLPYDDGGKIAAKGKVNEKLLLQLNELDYYKKKYPKSLPNSFGTEVIFPIIKNAGLGIEDCLCTYTEHILQQVSAVFSNSTSNTQHPTSNVQPPTLLITGGGALNTFLTEKIASALKEFHVEVVIPDVELINFKEALIMALIGVLRWREDANVLSSVTGAAKNSIGGALWMGI